MLPSEESKVDDLDSSAIPLLLEELDFYEPYITDDTWAAKEISDPTRKINVNHGKPIVLHFWATSCRPCRMATPFLNHVSRVHNDVQFLAIHRSEDEVKRNSHGIMYTLVHDTTGATTSRYKSKFNITGIPHVLVISKDGKVVYSGHPLDLGFQAALQQVSTQRTEGQFTVKAESWEHITPLFDAQLPNFTQGKYVLHLLDYLEPDRPENVAQMQHIIKNVPSEYTQYVLVTDEAIDLRPKLGLPQLCDLEANFLCDVCDLYDMPLKEDCYSLVFKDGEVVIVDGPSAVLMLLQNKSTPSDKS